MVLAVIEVEPHRTPVGVYTPVECSSDLMRRASISLWFLETDLPRFAGLVFDFLEILSVSFYPFTLSPSHPLALSPREL